MSGRNKMERQGGFLRFTKLYYYAGLSILILAVVVVGGYYYTLNRYAKEMDKLMNIFLTEMPVEESRQEQNMEKDNNSNSTESGQNSDSFSVNNENDLTAEDPTKEKTSTSAEKSRELQELEDKYTPVFQNIDLKDQLFLAQLLRKFSVDELQEMYHLYSAGGKSREELLKIMEEKLTQEELQRIKEIFQKNKDLL